MKKLFFVLTLFVIFFFTFALKANAEVLYKITNANFDTSNSMVVLSVQDTQGAIADKIKLVKLDNRAYFDINSS